MRRLLLAALIASPVLADPPPGIDDPAFRVPFERLLQADDPAALADLHAAAEAGNTAALLALPAAVTWHRTALPFAERKRLARIAGVSIVQALAAADPVAALWDGGAPESGMIPVRDRALGLLAAGEAEKGTTLFMIWLNQTGAIDPLPPDFFDQPIPRWAAAIVLQWRLQNSFAIPDEATLLTATRLKAGDPAAWLALAAYAGLARPETAPPLPETIPARIAAILAGAGIAPDEGARRMAAVAPALKAIALPQGMTLDADTAAGAAAVLAEDPDFVPVTALCRSACPDTAAACATAFVAGFGHPFGDLQEAEPFVSLIPTADFYATPRGRLEMAKAFLLPVDGQPTTGPSLEAARAIDACLADTLLNALP